MIKEFQETFKDYSPVELSNILVWFHEKNFFNKCGEDFLTKFWNEAVDKEDELIEKELENDVLEVLKDLDRMRKVYKRVEKTLKDVGYAPFDTKDNIEMYYTLIRVRDILKEVLGE